VRQLPDVLLMQANLAMHQRRYATALRHYDTLQAAVEVCLSVHLNRIECLIQLGRLDEAEATLETDASPLQGHFGRHVMLARLAARRQQSQRARAQVEAACQLNPQALSSAAAFPELNPSVWQIACAVWSAWQIETHLVCAN
jgi:thioredoxin-like negative regulator of GroEL